MQVTVFSVWMTVLWSSILISVFYVLRVKMVLYGLCSVTGIIVLYQFCFARMLFPVEFSWTRVIAASKVYNKIFDVLQNKIYMGMELRVYHLVALVWLTGAVLRFCGVLCQYRKTVQYFGSLPPMENGAAVKAAYRIAGDKMPYIVQTPVVRIPCCMGVFKKRILIPEKSFSDTELYYIIFHEYIHLQNNDFLVKMLINMLCAFYWWNPFVCLLKKDLNQSMEIRCDSLVVQRLGRQERSDYLSVILKEFKNSQDRMECNNNNQREAVVQLFESHPDSLVERFRLVAYEKQCQMKRGKLWICLIASGLLAMSYSFIIQTKFEVPLEEIESARNAYEVINESAYIIKHSNGSYIFHSQNDDIPLGENSVKSLIQDGFIMIESEEYP